MNVAPYEKLPVRARHSAPSMGSTPFWRLHGGKLALHRRHQGITNRGNVFQYAACVGDGRGPSGIGRGAPQPPDHQADQVSKILPLLPQYR